MTAWTRATTEAVKHMKRLLAKPMRGHGGCAGVLGILGRGDPEPLEAGVLPQDCLSQDMKRFGLPMLGPRGGAAGVLGMLPVMGTLKPLKRGGAPQGLSQPST